MDDLKLSRVSFLVESFRALLDIKQGISAETDKELVYRMYDFLDLLDEQIKTPSTTATEAEGAKC